MAGTLPPYYPQKAGSLLVLSPAEPMSHLCLSAFKSTDDFSELSFRISELAREPRGPRQQREDGSGGQGSLPRTVRGECGPGNPFLLAH